MYQFVEDLKESQYKKFIQEKKLTQKKVDGNNPFYIGIAKDKKLIACMKAFIEEEKQKKVMIIPLGIQTTEEDKDFYLFLKKYLLITAKKWNVQKITIYSKENKELNAIGFKSFKKKGESYLPLKKRKEKEIPIYFHVVDMDTDRNKRKLKELKKNNLDLFLSNNVSFYSLELDLYSYLDMTETEEEKQMILTIIDELGDQLILENITVEYFNDKEAKIIDIEEYSNLLKEKRKNLLFYKLEEELVNNGIHKLFFPNYIKSSIDLEQDIITEYNLSINSFM